jgi:hypothetical protein
MGSPPSFKASSVGRVLPIRYASSNGIEKVINDTVANVMLIVWNFFLAMLHASNSMLTRMNAQQNSEMAMEKIQRRNVGAANTQSSEARKKMIFKTNRTKSTTGYCSAVDLIRN